MAIDLTKPLAWKKATHDEQMMLKNLQGNILKGHGRPRTINVFFKIDTTKVAQMRNALREIANYHVTSAMQQLEETEAFKLTGKSGETFVAMMLSASGYAALGVPAAKRPNNPVFAAGMKAATSVAALGDPAVATWEAAFQGQIDGLVLIGSITDSPLLIERDHIVTLLIEGGATIVHQQSGEAILNLVGDGIEHFGYVDGRSQPLMLVEDIEQEAKTAGIGAWDPQFALNAALIADPGVDPGVVPNLAPPSFGSYFVFRKLEQDAQGFKRREQQLADALLMVGADARELAGAMAVGRFEDGTPVTLSDEAKGQTPPNDFTYKSDPGARCPFQAHVRKVNPRGTGGAELENVERGHIMPRRGIPYTDIARKTHPSTLPGSDTLTDFNAKVAPLLPTGGVGLLFMAYNSDINKQFQFTQQTWANNPGFPIVPPPATGIDPVMANGSASTQNWPKAWGVATPTTPFAFSGFVKMKGGEYFFAPSLGFLKAL